MPHAFESVNGRRPWGRDGERANSVASVVRLSDSLADRHCPPIERLPSYYFALVVENPCLGVKSPVATLM